MVLKHRRTAPRPAATAIISKVLTGLGRKQVVLVRSLHIQHLLDLVVDLLGFRLLNKNVAVVGLQKLERDLADPQFFILQAK